MLARPDVKMSSAFGTDIFKDGERRTPQSAHPDDSRTKDAAVWSSSRRMPKQSERRRIVGNLDLEFVIKID